MSHTPHPARLALTAAFALLLMTPALHAQAPTTESEARQLAAGTRWAGSMVALQQDVGAVGLARDAEPTWNPYASLSLALLPRFRVAEGLTLTGRVTASRELTHSDVTTDAGETWLSDTTLTLTMLAPTMAAIGTTLAAHARVQLPTSKASLARTLRVGGAVGVSSTSSAGFTLAGLSQRLTLQLVGRVGHLWHDYTTASLDTPWLSNCSELTRGCARYSHTGVRNVQWQTQMLAALSWSIHPRLALTVQAGAFLDRLYPLSESTKTREGLEVALDATDPSTRGAAIYVVDLSWQVLDALAISAGAQTFTAQLQPDSTYRRPFFNRETALYLGLSLFPDTIASALRAGQGAHP